MRIFGSDTGSAGGENGQNGGGKNRSDSFRNGHHIGQKIRGKLVRWVSNDMAWISIDNQNLLAQLKSTPSVGDELVFIIEQLQPEIILKEILEPTSANITAISLASSFEAARAVFESLFTPHTTSLTSTPAANRMAAFFQILREDLHLLTAFHDALACMQTIRKQTKNFGILLYQPWLIPEARRHITIIRTQTAGDNPHIINVSVECETSHLGMVRANFMHKKPETGYYLYVQNMTYGNQLKRYLESTRCTVVPTNTQCLGVHKLPQYSHGGILAELLFTKP